MPSGVCQMLAVGVSPARASALAQAMPAKSGIMRVLRSSGRCGRLEALAENRAVVGDGRGSAGSVVDRPLGRRRIERRADDLRACRLRYCSARLSRAATMRAWIWPAARLSRMPPSASIVLELVPGRFAQRVGQRLDAARARSRIGDEIDMALLGHDELRVAGDRVGQRRPAGRARCCAAGSRSNRRRRRPPQSRRSWCAGCWSRGPSPSSCGRTSRHGSMPCDGGIEQASWTRAHSMRSALILAIDRNWSWSTLSAKPICGAA